MIREFWPTSCGMMWIIYLGDPELNRPSRCGPKPLGTQSKVNQAERHSTTQPHQICIVQILMGFKLPIMVVPHVVIWLPTTTSDRRESQGSTRGETLRAPEGYVGGGEAVRQYVGGGETEIRVRNP